MKAWCIFLIYFFKLIYQTQGKTAFDSTSQRPFQILSEKMRLKAPNLKEGEYEVRIWNKQALRYGDAQLLYVLLKKERLFTVSKYIIESDRRGFKYAILLNPNPKIPIDIILWEKLLQNDILTLPDQVKIEHQLHPRQTKDSTYVSIEKDGSASIHARKQIASVWILDGESYCFEIFSHDGYRNYAYSNPRGYLSSKPDIVELQKVIAILNDLAILFRSSN